MLSMSIGALALSEHLHCLMEYFLIELTDLAAEPGSIALDLGIEIKYHSAFADLQV